jgi:hypothetical protein
MGFGSGMFEEELVVLAGGRRKKEYYVLYDYGEMRFNGRDMRFGHANM